MYLKINTSLLPLLGTTETHLLAYLQMIQESKSELDSQFVHLDKEDMGILFGIHPRSYERALQNLLSHNLIIISKPKKLKYVRLNVEGINSFYKNNKIK